MSTLAFSSDLTLDQEKQILIDLDLRAQKKWEPLEEFQSNPLWIKDQLELGLYGPIYDKGWLNPRVSRQIIPDLTKGFLVVDRVVLGENIMTQVASVSTNLLLGYYFPYIQGGPIYDKVFTRIKHAPTYKEALETEIYKIQKFPFNYNEFTELSENEVHSTVTTNGFFTRLSLGLFDMMGLNIPSPINLGPKIKYHLKKSMKVSITKESEDIIIIALEDINEHMAGAGIGLGVYFEELINLPISIGIDGQNGYSPIVANFKKTTQKIKSLVYKIDLSKELGLKAYQDFLNSDLTTVQDLSLEEQSPVKVDIVKEGTVETKERNFAINLILYRSGERNITVNGKYNTTLPDGKKYDYDEVIRKRVLDRKGFSGEEKDILTFSTIIPKSTNQNNFVLDTLYYYEDTKAKGEELNEVSQIVKLLGIPAGIPMRFDEDRNYGKIQLQAKMRFTSQAIRKIFESSSNEKWISLASALGHNDPYIWESPKERNNYINKYYVSNFKRNNFHSSKNKHRLSKLEKEKIKYLEKIEFALKIMNRFEEVQATNNGLDRAKKLVELLNHKKFGLPIHKFMIDLAGQDLIMGRGHIRGRTF
ncbi:hypothetical protein [Halobacteriovorax sp. HLS]|uniref:hypothetical protein n=1 Tax=Halobacteriovorax sp. HLS TaxID=2234000 RepID=UPI000FDAA7E9|nr:hypothetical protein [Halobacteriovorax sp. HLS]